MKNFIKRIKLRYNMRKCIKGKYYLDKLLLLKDENQRGIGKTTLLVKISKKLLKKNIDNVIVVATEAEKYWVMREFGIKNVISINQLEKGTRCKILIDETVSIRKLDEYFYKDIYCGYNKLS